MVDPAPHGARRALHGVAELVLAGPQYRRSGTIRLRPVPGGFGTVAAPDLRVEGAFLVAGGRRLALAGTSARELAEAAGVEVGAPGIYADGSGVAPDDPIDVDGATAAGLAACYSRGDEALRSFAPELTPVLWPEHFDLGITIDAVNYGCSPGDDAIPEPYLYVGPHSGPPAKDAFWNAPFGAVLSSEHVSGTADAGTFFTRGRTLVEHSRAATR
jgi:hypothetical protein